ncbi:unnamed protein product [Polarella glacialis]|uniref:Uncharacterized protein n=1 Tax=Polarella glacialis TaxID=89957 RepID=A0A813LWS5_POLGL|nr:unnamed protein product [Polarella glacialis]
MAWLAAARFQKQQEVDYCRTRGKRVLAKVTDVSLSEGVFHYHLKYDINNNNNDNGNKSGIAKPRVAWDVPEWQLLEMQTTTTTTPPASPMMRCHSQWISELKEGDQVFHERCNGEAVVATVLEVYQDEEACRLEYLTLVKDDIGNSRERLRTALVSFSSLLQQQRQQQQQQHKQEQQLQSGPPVEKRALRLRELQDLRSLIEERCAAEFWHDQETLEPLLPEEVNLYHLNHFLICPSTVPEGVLIHCPGIDTARARCGQVVVQSDPNSAWADQVVGEGEVTGVLGIEGQKWLIVRVCRGRFVMS